MGKKPKQGSSDYYFTSQQKAKELVSNSNYILWLERFTKKHPSFYDDDWLYQQDQITKEDHKNVHQFQYFFKGIDAYAQKNYIPEQSSDSDLHCIYYLIKYNNIGYMISLIIGQGAVNYCERTEKITDEFIDFQDIIDGKKPESAYVIESKFEELSTIIKELLELKVSRRSIENVVQNVFKEH